MPQTTTQAYVAPPATTHSIVLCSRLALAWRARRPFAVVIHHYGFLHSATRPLRDSPLKGCRKTQTKSRSAPPRLPNRKITPKYLPWWAWTAPLLHPPGSSPLRAARIRSFAPRPAPSFAASTFDLSSPLMVALYRNGTQVGDRQEEEEPVHAVLR